MLRLAVSASSHWNGSRELAAPHMLQLARLQSIPCYTRAVLCAYLALATRLRAQISSRAFYLAVDCTLW